MIYNNIGDVSKFIASWMGEKQYTGIMVQWIVII